VRGEQTTPNERTAMSSLSISASASCEGVITYTIIPEAPADADIIVLEVWTNAPGGLNAAAPGTWTVGVNGSINGVRRDGQTTVTVPEACQATTTTQETTPTTITEQTTTTIVLPTTTTLPEQVLIVGPTVPGYSYGTTSTTVPSDKPQLPATGADGTAVLLGLGVVCCVIGWNLASIAKKGKGLAGRMLEAMLYR
jgi:hypothetical protein